MGLKERHAALLMLREKPHRDIYQGSDGLYYISYSAGKGPTLTAEDIDILIREVKIKQKWEGCYVLA